MANFDPLTAETCWRVWGTPANFSVTARHSSSGRQPNFAALNRGRHLYSAGRSSRWALAHIVVSELNWFSLINMQYTCSQIIHKFLHLRYLLNRLVVTLLSAVMCVVTLKTAVCVEPWCSRGRVFVVLCIVSGRQWNSTASASSSKSRPIQRSTLTVIVLTPGLADSPVVIGCHVSMRTDMKIFQLHRCSRSHCYHYSFSW